MSIHLIVIVFFFKIISAEAEGEAEEAQSHQNSKKLNLNHSKIKFDHSKFTKLNRVELQQSDQISQNSQNIIGLLH